VVTGRLQIRVRQAEVAELQLNAKADECEEEAPVDNGHLRDHQNRGDPIAACAARASIATKTSEPKGPASMRRCAPVSSTVA
jgi:hypothetical protein